MCVGTYVVNGNGQWKCTSTATVERARRIQARSRVIPLRSTVVGALFNPLATATHLLLVAVDASLWVAGHMNTVKDAGDVWTIVIPIISSMTKKLIRVIPRSRFSAK